MPKIKKHILALIISVVFLTSFLAGCSNEYLLNKVSKNISSYFIDLTYDNNSHSAEVSQRVVFKNNSGTTLSNVKFNLHVKAFTQAATNKPVSTLNEEKAYPNGLSYGDIVFESIKNEGKMTSYALEEIDKNILNISLLKPLKSGYSTIIEMLYTITIPNVYHRYGYGENAINLGNFYPTLCVIEKGEFVVQPYSYNGDPFYSDLANYVVNITAPSEYVVASTGSKINSEATNSKTKTTFQAKAVRDFCLVLSDKFEVLTKKSGKTTIYYYYYDDENSQKSLTTAYDALNTFSNLIGEYPYSTLSVVKTHFVHGGMEYPNLIYVSDSIENYEDYTNVIVHEIAHQWWYGVVGNNSFTYGWLDEGLTEYTTALFYEKNPNYNIKFEEVIENARSAYNMFQQVYTEIFGEVDTTLTRSLSEYKTEPEYVYMAYVKAMLLFHELREVVGVKRFEKALKYYYKQNRFKNVTPKDFIKAFEKSTNRNLNSWFDAWVEGKVIIKEL